MVSAEVSAGRTTGHRLKELVLAAALLACSAAQAQTDSGSSAVRPGLPPPSASTNPGASGGAASGNTGANSTQGTTGGGGGAGLAAPTLRLSGWRFSSSGGLSETFSTNGQGLANGFTNAIGSTAGSGSDFVTQLNLSFDAHDHTGRFDGDLSYGVAGILYAHQSQFDSVYQTINGLARAVVIPDRLMIQGGAFAAPVPINNLGQLSASGIPVGGGLNSGYRDSYAYNVSADLYFRFGSFAKAETVLQNSGISYGGAGTSTFSNIAIPGIGNVPGLTFVYGATQSFASGTDFNRLNWVISASGTEVDSSGLTLTQADGTGQVKYAFTRQIAATSMLGYKHISSNQMLTEDVSGIIAFGGLELRPNEDFFLAFQAGEQFQSPSYTGTFRWQITPLTAIQADYQDAIFTPAARSLFHLGSLGVNGGGGFFDTSFQANPVTPPTTINGANAFQLGAVDSFSIANLIERFRGASASIIHDSGRMQYRFTATETTFDSLTDTGAAPPLSGNSWSAGLFAGRRVNTKLTASAEIQYSVQNAIGYGYSYALASLQLTYAISERMESYARADFIHRNSNEQLAVASPLSGDLTGADFSIGITRRFY